MAWVESHTVLVRHRKTVSFALELGISPVMAVGLLTVLWHTVLEQAEDGDLAKWGDKYIAAAAQWDGNADKFCQALRNNGWLDGHLIHDWLDYAGRYLESRYRTSQPERLKQIHNKHKIVESSRSKVGLKTPHLTNLPTIPTYHKEQELIFNVWNDRMPWKIREISESRLTHLKERLKEKQFVGEFHTILTNILESDFLSGRTPSKDHKNFRADFDWLIKNDNNYIKILEGKYANAREKEVAV